MDQVLEILKTAFARSLGQALGALVGFGALVLVVALLAAPLYVLLRWRSANADRSEFIQRLDAVDRVATSAYEVMMYVAIAAMTGLAVFFYLAIRDDYWRDFLLLYGGVVYLIGMLWATSQLYWIRRRRAGEPARSIRSALSQVGSKFELDVQTAEPQVFSLDDAALERAHQHLARGGTIDEACALVVPRYESMNGFSKSILRKAVEAALAARQR